MAYKPPMHGRDHCPGGSDPIPAACFATAIAWARRSRPYTSANQLIGNSSFDAFDMVNNYNMGSGESGEEWFQPETGGNADGIVVQQNAFVLITIGLMWFDVVNATWWPWVSIDPSSGTTRLMFPEFAGTAATTQRGHWTTHSRCSAGDIIIAGVWQSSGGNRNVDASYLEVSVLGTWSGTAPTAMDPDNI